MGEGTSTLVIIAIIVIVVLVAIWLVTSLDSNGGNCVGPRPDPVGGITTESRPNGEVEISWDRPENAVRFKVYVNACPAQSVQGKKKLLNSNQRKHKVGACGGDCCPGTCDSCVSQSNYKKLFETDDTSLVIKTCEPCLCFLVVPYNSCGQAGPCNEVNFVNVQCTVDELNAWIASNDCNGTIIKWEAPDCADVIHIWVAGEDIEQVDASDGMIALEQIPDGLEIAVQAETSCGLGQLVVIRQGDMVLASKTFATQQGKAAVSAPKFDVRSLVIKKRKKRRAPQPRRERPIEISKRSTRSQISLKK